jgi:O-antigen/teichoic acid export membrane protein
MILVMLGAAVVVAIASNPVLRLFGEEFLAGQVPVLILLGMAFFRGLSGIVSLHVLGRGKAYTITIITIVVLAIAVLLNALLIPRFGAIGAALAITGAELVNYLLWLVLYRVVTNGDVKALFAISRSDFRLTWNEGKSYVKRFTNGR